MADYGFSIDGITTDNQGFVHLQNGQEFAFRLKNNTNAPCNAYIVVQGKGVGGFRLPPGADVRIERPVATNRKFVFVREGTIEADAGGIVTGNSLNGLVEAQFVPKLNTTSVDMIPEDRAPGGIALGAISTQTFTKALPLIVDWDRKQSLYLRLVAKS